MSCRCLPSAGTNNSFPEQQARTFHTCQVRHRQLIASGGLQPNVASDYEVADLWPQGLGILDLTEMTWKSSYDSTTSPYETPQQIKDYVAANGQYPQQWKDELLEQWFTGRSFPKTNSTSAPAHTSSPLSSSSHSSSDTGAIVGGVVGGVGGIILLAALAWFILRRRPQSRAEAAGRGQPRFEKAELEGRQDHTGQSHTSAYWETQKSRELDGRPVQEMPGSPAEHELSSKRG